MESLREIQAELKAPKNLYNSCGKYSYRFAEDILEAVKPLLLKHNATLTISDEIVEVGGRVYVKATCTFRGEKEVQVSAFARESIEQKGMNEAQITGSASSYARKYALNGLFLIDDTKDADATNKHGKEEKEEAQPSIADLVKKVNACKSRVALTKIWNENKELHQNQEFAGAVVEKSKEYPKE